MKTCCVLVKDLPENIVKVTSCFKIAFNFIEESKIKWIERKDAETDYNYKQIIPYVIIQKSDGKIACYQRHGSEKRLAGLYSCGFGGHIEESDIGKNFYETLQKGMIRELSEEISNFNTKFIDLNYLGIINEVESNVGLVHLGCVYLAKCDEAFIPQESDETKGLEWKTFDELQQLETELWTKLALKLI